MSNFRLSWRNYVFTEDCTLAVTAGTVSAGSVDNLKTMRLSDKATIVDTVASGDAVIELSYELDSGAPGLPVGLIGLLNYTLSHDGATSVTWEVSIDGGAFVDISDLVWQRPNSNMPLHLWYFPTEDNIYEVVFRITATFSSAGTLMFAPGALWVGPLWATADGMEATWSNSVTDAGRMGRSEGSQGFPRRKPKYRVYEGRAVHVPFEWAYGDENDDSILDIQQLQYYVGVTEPVVLFPRTLNASGEYSVHSTHRLGVYGHFEDIGRIEHMGGDLYQWTQARLAELL